MPTMISMPALPQLIIGTAAGSAMLCVGLIILLRPLLERYALAHPSARSSHLMPTPQGGGIAIVTATIVATVLASLWAVGEVNGGLLVVLAAATCLGLVGAVDDVRPLRPDNRLIFQTLAVTAVVATLPSNIQIFPILPLLVDRITLVITGVWFVNLVNFMDGIDLITVSEIVPLTGAIIVFGLFGLIPLHGLILAVALLGGVLGFAPFNAPRAQLFMGDVGSLPIGLIVGWLLAQLAFGGHLAAALLLPLYYLVDSTITLLRRIVAGKHIFTAHREHYYQRALDGGHSVVWIVSQLFLVNLGLDALALFAVFSQSTTGAVSATVLASVLVAFILWRFIRK